MTMTDDQAKAEVARLLLERAEMRRLGIELPPQDLMLLKRLMYRLGMNNVKLQRRQALLRLARRIGVKRYAKLDGHVVAHSLVQGFPIENALRHLANDPNNHPSIRELAKVAVTGGKDGDGSNIPMALWALHDELHTHKHPAKDWYNWMSAADKIGLDAHTYRALKEAAEDQRRIDARSGMVGAFPNLLPDANGLWSGTPEAHAVMAVQGMDDPPVNSSYSINRKDLLNRIRTTVKGFVPHATEPEIDESIRRHAHRSGKVWRKLQAGPAGPPGGLDETIHDERDIAPFKERKFPVPRPHLNLNEKATRYRRILRRLARRSGAKRLPEGYISPEGEFHQVGPKEMHYHVAERLAGSSHRAKGEDARRVVEQQGYMHVGYLEQGDVPGQTNVSLHGYHPDRNFTGLQIETLKSLAAKHGISEVTLDGRGQSNPVKLAREPSNTEGLRRYGRSTPESMIDVRKALGEPQRMSRKGSPERYQMVAGDFLGALRRIRSSDQHAIRRTTEEIAAKLGLKPASTVDALHNSPAYSVPGVAQAIYANAPPESVHAAAAWYGLTGNIPGMAVFHVRPDGPDMLHRFRMQGSGHDMLAKLDKAGIADRVLVPHRKGFDLLIPDRGGKMRDRVREFTQRQKTELQSSRGHFKLIGAADQAKAREMFRNTITSQERKAV